MSPSVCAAPPLGSKESVAPVSNAPGYKMPRFILDDKFLHYILKTICPLEALFQDLNHEKKGVY